MKKIKNRVALITGAGSGIGKTIALKFAREGANIAIVDINHDASKEVLRKIKAMGSKAIFIACDVTDETQVKQAVATTIKELGALHILVNNAGISSQKEIDQISLAEWNHVIAVNLTGPFLITKAALPYLKKAGKIGRVINMGSLAGQIGGISVGIHYTASKGGIMSITKQLAKILAPFEVTVNNISPGTTDTPLVKNFSEESKRALAKQIPLGRFGQPDDIACTALFLASDDAQFITGATINVNGGMYIA